MSDDLTEAALVDMIAAIWSTDPAPPMHLVVTEEGIEIQRARFQAGELTAEDMEAANIPTDLIARVVAP